jgi:hypothetical protein
MVCVFPFSDFALHHLQTKANHIVAAKRNKAHSSMDVAIPFPTRGNDTTKPATQKITSAQH